MHESISQFIYYLVLGSLLKTQGDTIYLLPEIIIEFIGRFTLKKKISRSTYTSGIISKMKFNFTKYISSYFL